MPATLLVALCLAADTPVSSPLPQPNRVLRDDERPLGRATMSGTAAATGRASGKKTAGKGERAVVE